MIVRSPASQWAASASWVPCATPQRTRGRHLATCLQVLHGKARQFQLLCVPRRQQHAAPARGALRLLRAIQRLGGDEPTGGTFLTASTAATVSSAQHQAHATVALPPAAKTLQQARAVAAAAAEAPSLARQQALQLRAAQQLASLAHPAPDYVHAAFGAFFCFLALMALMAHSRDWWLDLAVFGGLWGALWAACARWVPDTLGFFPLWPACAQPSRHGGEAPRCC